jgi:predicted transcriptional regulator
LYLDLTTVTYEDIVLAAGAAAMVAAVILSLTVLSRYRSLSVQTAKSNELARDLWGALENRLSKQDERMVDLMAKVEIYGVRTEKGTNQPLVGEKSRIPVPTATPVERVAVESMPAKTTSTSSDVEREILESLSGGPKSSTEIKTVIDKSREHTARLMKSLFDDGYVIRNDRNKPFVYEITEAGRRYLTDNRSAGT